MSMIEHQNCPACGEGRLVLKHFSQSVEFKGTTGDIDQVARSCTVCKAELFDDECGKLNRRAFVAFQKKVQEVPSGKEIKKLRKQLGLSSQLAGELLGGGPKAFSKYENDEIVPRGAMRTLVKYLLKHPERINEVLESNGHPPVGKAVPVSMAHVALTHVVALDTIKAFTEKLRPYRTYAFAASEGSGYEIVTSGVIWDANYCMPGSDRTYLVPAQEPLAPIYPTLDATEEQFIGGWTESLRHQ